MLNLKITSPIDDNYSDDELTFLPFFTFLFSCQAAGKSVSVLLCQCTEDATVPLRGGWGLAHTHHCPPSLSPPPLFLFLCRSGQAIVATTVWNCTYSILTANVLHIKAFVLKKRSREVPESLIFVIFSTPLPWLTLLPPPHPHPHTGVSV